jgi:hypothetical protein
LKAASAVLYDFVGKYNQGEEPGFGKFHELLVGDFDMENCPLLDKAIGLIREALGYQSSSF